MTRMQQFQSVIDAWKRKDIEAVLGAMTDDVVWHYAAAIAPPARGKAEARAFIEAFGANIGEVRWRIFHHSEVSAKFRVNFRVNFQRDMHVISLPVVCSENRPKAGTN